LTEIKKRHEDRAGLFIDNIQENNSLIVIAAARLSSQTHSQEL
jgi:hypothetical protein